MNRTLPSAQHVSAEMKRLNPAFYGVVAGVAIPDQNPIACSGKPSQKIGKRRGAMNKTEARFAAILEAKRLAGEILSWHYEGLTLRWGTLDCIRYTPDFLVFDGIAADGRIRLIETKGGHIWEKDIQKFKAARNQWPQFVFELWRYEKREWRQAY